MTKKKIVILSTKTDHHTYFINRLYEEGFDIAGVVYENEMGKPSFNATSPFGKKEIDFEKSKFFIKVPRTVYRKIKINNVKTINTLYASKVVRNLKADLGVVFGCGKIRPHVFQLTKMGLINIHRGLSEEYRGLDCDLWPIYHSDYQNMGVTVHQVDEKLDTGNIIYIKRMKLKKGMKTHEIRYYTTIIATDLVIRALKNLEKSKIKFRNQRKKGRYYSFMPLSLKKIVEERFNNYCKNLDEE